MHTSHRYRAYWVWLLAACALNEPILTIPCDSTQDCAESLAHHYDGHQCIENRCIRPSNPDSQTPPVDAGGGGGVYDAGTGFDSGQSWDCQRDSDCQDGQICGDGVCVDVETGCDNDGQCPNGQVCRDSACLTSCTGHAGCEPSLVCLGTVCVEKPTCFSSCPADLLCVGEYCIRPECYDGHPCPNTQSCQQGRCRAVSRVDAG
jgi:hypothetical protein